MSTSLAYAYANTQPNTKTVFPPNNQVFKASAPWATMSGFTLPPGSGVAGCSGSQFQRTDHLGPSGTCATRYSVAYPQVMNPAHDCCSFSESASMCSNDGLHFHACQ